MGFGKNNNSQENIMTEKSLYERRGDDVVAFVSSLKMT